MKYGFMPKAMWEVFRKSFKRAIGEILPDEDAAAVMKRAKKEYKKILADVDEFDKDSPFVFNIYSCAMLSAVLLNLENKYDVETVRRYYSKAMDNKIMRSHAKHSKAYTVKGREKIKKVAEDSLLRNNPYDWKLTVEDGETINEYTATFLTCGICYLMNKLGLGEYIPAMCAYDYDMAAMNNTEFYREYTLASGGKYCDCHYKHKAQ